MNLRPYSQIDVMIILLIIFFALLINIINFSFNSTFDTVINILSILIAGYSIVLVIYPGDNISILRKISYGSIVCIILYVLIFLIENVFSNLTIFTSGNYIIIISIITLIFISIAYIKRNSTPTVETKYIICDECKRYYIPEDGESLKDFEKCTCGGNLFYSKYSEMDVETKNYSYDLLLILILSGFTLLFLFIPPLNPISTILGSFLILFFCGYSITATIFPTGKRINLMTRTGLNVIISLLFTLGIGLILNLTIFKGNINMIIMILSLISIFGVIISYIRRFNVPYYQQFDPVIYNYLSNLKGSIFDHRNGGGKLSLLLIIIILLSVGSISYLVAYPNSGESFTEFYLLGSNGKASDYPTNLTTGSRGNLIIGIVNHEHQTTFYKLVVTSNGKEIDTKNLTLNDGQKMDINYSFVAGGSGNKKIEFLLYKLPDEKNVYLDINLKVYVK